MRKTFLIFAAFVAPWSVAYAESLSTLDALLTQVKNIYELTPIPVKRFAENPRYKLGRFLFFDPILSGNRDVSCSTCHLLKYGSSDGLPKGVGAGGIGMGPNRKASSRHPKQPRNSIELWNRDNNSVTSLRWDGAIQVSRDRYGGFQTPLGQLLPNGFENLMAIQSVMPLTRPDEMLGLPNDFSARKHPPPHASLTNEMAKLLTDDLESHLQVFDKVVQRLINSGSEYSSTYRQLFADAYPRKAIQNISIVDLGNALSHFIELTFASRDTPWDKYLAGDFSQLDEQQKRGAILFFGKAKCAVCHDGHLFSDFDYHSIGLPQPSIDEGREGIDLGRYLVTNNPLDKHKFRTPPLRNVTLTGPYFHDGRESSLEGAVRSHINPKSNAGVFYDDGSYKLSLEQVEVISPYLTFGLSLSDAEVDSILAFLKSLEDRGALNLKHLVPDAVPSGLPFHS